MRDAVKEKELSVSGDDDPKPARFTDFSAVCRNLRCGQFHQLKAEENRFEDRQREWWYAGV